MARKGPNPIDVYVGARIRTRRVSLGLSQETLSRALGVTFQQVQKYEKGANRVSASRLHQIAGVLQATPAYFFEGSGPALGRKRSVSAPSGHSHVSEFGASVEGLALVKAFFRISDPTLRRHIVALVSQINPVTD